MTDEEKIAQKLIELEELLKKQIEALQKIGDELAQLKKQFPQKTRRYSEVL